MGIYQMWVDQMGVDQVGINRKYMMCWELTFSEEVYSMNFIYKKQFHSIMGKV
jgi:hypothetical protein